MFVHRGGDLGTIAGSGSKRKGNGSMWLRWQFCVASAAVGCAALHLEDER